MTAPFLICVGNAIVDILVKVEDSFLKSNDFFSVWLNTKKGSASSVTSKFFIIMSFSNKYRKEK